LSICEVTDDDVFMLLVGKDMMKFIYLLKPKCWKIYCMHEQISLLMQSNESKMLNIVPRAMLIHALHPIINRCLAFAAARINTWQKMACSENC